MEYPFKDLLPLDEVLEREGYYKDWSHIDADTFHQISELVKFIREKGYGADTREAIAQALERVYHDALQSGNANMEVSMARNHFEDLASRLDASDYQLASTTAQLAHKVTKNRGEITSADLSQEVKEQMTGGSVAVVGENAVGTINLIDKSTTYDKLNLNGVDILPKSFGFRLVNDDIRAESGVVRFEKGDKIEVLDGANVQFALVRPDETTAFTYRQFHSIQEDVLFKVKVRKTDDSLITPSELQNFTNQILVTNSKSLANFDIANQFIANKILSATGLRLNQIDDVIKSSNLFNANSAIIGKMANLDGKFVTHPDFYLSAPLKFNQDTIVTASYIRTYEIYREDGKFSGVGENTEDNTATRTVNVPKGHSLYVPKQLLHR